MNITEKTFKEYEGMIVEHRKLVHKLQSKISELEAQNNKLTEELEIGAKKAINDALYGIDARLDSRIKELELEVQRQEHWLNIGLHRHSIGTEKIKRLESITALFKEGIPFCGRGSFLRRIESIINKDYR